MSTFAEKLKSARKRKDLSIRELAGKVNIGTRQLLRYEHGESRPRPRVVKELSRALEVPPKYFTDELASAKRISHDSKLDKNWGALKKFGLSKADEDALNHLLELFIVNKQVQRLGLGQEVQ
jgi:transcriptional regulator with XRE-family HTH domain